ncbi:MAG: hypothetical protein KA792_04230 [Bacteroidales bacterium]|nr:hypothetical protein [Bacteroidales bacterium]
MNSKSSFFKVVIFIFAIAIFAGCKKDEINKNNSQTTTGNIKGYAQKGPFIEGSAVTVYDLQSDLSQSGKSFNAQITDNKGTFELNGLSLSSDYINLRADGFYFNEVSGQLSASQITLYAISDISDKKTINVNLLTHLEKSRVEYLFNSGKSFSDSKKQAQKEILDIFNIQQDSIMKSSENLNIAEAGDDNAVLLAISSILQGFRSEGELTGLLSNISRDIKTDGILNDTALGSELINHTIYLDTNSIKNNLIKRYKETRVTPDIPYFGKYIKGFISKTKFPVTKGLITYPATGLNGENILSLSKNEYKGGESITDVTFSLAAHLTKGTALKIKITAKTIIPPDTGSVNTVPIWYYNADNKINWYITTFDSYTQTFTAIESGKSCDLKMYFDKGTFLIEYFEMNSNQPTRTKTITVI